MKTMNFTKEIAGLNQLRRLTLIAVIVTIAALTTTLFAQDKSYKDFLEQKDFSLLKSALDESGVELSKKKSFAYTFFAPTNDAFEALGEKTLEYLFSNPEELARILSYHFVPTKVYAEDLSDGQIVTMKEGTDAFISLFDGKAFINQAEIIDTDKATYFGVIHTIDAVITQPSSIVDIVVNSPRHNTLETAVIAAELAGALSAPGSFTLFAPTDAAFAALGEETINTLLADPTGALAEILKYHVVGATAFSGDLSDGDMFATLEGSEIKVSINEEGVFINDAQVVFADYAAPNGVVHVIDAVITPPVETNTVVDVIVNSEVHESLEAAVVAAGLVDALSSEGPFTVFAPTDAAFAALGQETINALFAEPTGALSSILQYHVVAGNVMAENLNDGQQVEMLEGSTAYVSLYNGMAYINQAIITVTDIEADNGVVHVIDAVITQPQSVLDLISINPRLQWLEEAIYEAGLEDFFSRTNYFTFFAPTYEAWLAYLTSIFGDSNKKADMDYSELLFKHLLETEAYSDQMYDGAVMQSMAGLDLFVRVNQDGILLNDSKIIYSDMAADNGVLHIIDNVISEASSTSLEEFSDLSGSISVYPNPTSERATVSFELMRDSDVQMQIIDLTGKTVKSESYGQLNSGYHEMNVSLSDLYSGYYVVKINSSAGSFSQRLSVN